MRVLVTGGAGYIGSHTCKQLALSGHEAVTYDNLSTGHAWAVRWGPFVKGDIADAVTLDAALKAYQIEAVVHFAANAYVGESMTDPLKYFRNNIAGSINLLETVLKNGITRFVFSSTCAVYGIPSEIAATEATPLKPASPYGESKRSVEAMLHWLGETKGLQWIALRYFNAAGADSECEIGEHHIPETHLIPLVLRATVKGATPIEVLGTDYPTPDGTAIRDYVHVVDLARAHVAALDLLTNRNVNRAFNLGSGVGASVMDVIAAAERVTGFKVNYVCGPRRSGDSPLFFADTSRANSELGWRATNSGLIQILQNAWAWEKKLASNISL